MLLFDSLRNSRSERLYSLVRTVYDVLAFEYLFGNIDDAVKAYQTQAKLLLGRQAKGERAPIVNDTVWPPTVRGWFSATVDNRPRMIEIDTADVIGVPGWQEAHNG